MDVGQWDLNGVLAGLGTVWQVTPNLDGLGSPELRVGGVLLPNNHGGVSTQEDWAGFRRWELELDSNGDPDTVHGRYRQLMTAMQPVTGASWKFQFRRPGWGELLSYVRPEQVTPVFQSGGRKVTVQVRLIAHDPVLYSADLTTATLSPYVGTQFASYPVDQLYPKVYGSGGTGGGQIVANGGSWPVWPRFVIEGPTSGTMSVSALENATTGGKVSFTADGGLDIPSGSTLVVDMHPARRVVQFTSGASRLNTVADLSSWFLIERGDNELRLRAGGDTAGASAEVQVRDGWL